MGQEVLADQITALFEANEVEVVPTRSDPLGGLKTELAQYISEMKGIRAMHPDQAMTWLSSVSARVMEMIYVTLDSESRAFTKFRIDRLIPLREELRFQFQIASRRVSHERFEWEMAGGQGT